MAHTPGPWTSASGYVTDQSGVEIADVMWAGDDQEGSANAELIAASPELLAALKRVVQYIDEYPTGGYHINDVIRQCRALIAKAEGRGE